jgi:hypothetical protein
MPDAAWMLVMLRWRLALLVLALLPAAAACSGGGTKGGQGGQAGVGGPGGGGGEASGGIGGAGAMGGNAATAPDVLIVLDRSGSMNDGVDGTSCAGGCGASSKWALLTAELGSVLSSNDTALSWGLELFASNDACGVSGVDVAPQLSNGATIATKLSLTSAASSTPTTAAITAAAAYLSKLTDGARKYIVLVTDGAPTCGASPCPLGSGNMTNECDDANAIAAVKHAYSDLGIPTFVLGVGAAGVAEVTLTQLALEGGAPGAAAPFYYPVGSAGELSAAFATIVAIAAP